MTVESLLIVVDGQPFGKQRPRFSRATGTVYTPEKTAKYENLVAWTAQAKMAGRPLIEGPVQVTITAYVGIPESKPKRWKQDAMDGKVWPTKKPDIDNVLKAVADSLNLVVWRDDSQIVDLYMRKRYTDRPRVEISVKAIDNLSTPA